MINKIIQEFTGVMSGVLSATQKKEAAEALSKILQKYTVAEVSEKHTGELLPKFLSAKSIEGCSAKSLKYYKSTIRTMLESVGKPEQEITTDEVNYHFKCKILGEIVHLQQSLPVPSSAGGPSSTGCMSGTLPSGISHCVTVPKHASLEGTRKSRLACKLSFIRNKGWSYQNFIPKPCI